MTAPITTTEMKQHDTAPPILITCSGEAGAADLTSATGIRIIGSLDKGKTVLFDKAVTGNADGEVELVWATGDTALAKPISVEVEVTWGDGTIQTFPRTGYLTIKVNPDLG